MCSLTMEEAAILSLDDGKELHKKAASRVYGLESAVTTEGESICASVAEARFMGWSHTSGGLCVGF